MCAEPSCLGQELVIDPYQVIIEGEDSHRIVDLSAQARGLTIPPELFEDDTRYPFGVLAREQSGNQTVSAGFFCTGPVLTAAPCEARAEL